MNWTKASLLLLIVALGCTPVLYSVLPWWPHNHLANLLSGRIAITVDAALVVTAAIRFSRWWLVALVAPLFDTMVVLSRSV